MMVIQAPTEGFIYYESCIYMVLELSTSYVLIIICFSKCPVPSAKKKTDVTGIFAGCQNQNFGRCVTRNKACQIDRNGTVIPTLSIRNQQTFLKQSFLSTHLQPSWD